MREETFSTFYCEFRAVEVDGFASGEEVYIYLLCFFTAALKVVTTVIGTCLGVRCVESICIVFFFWLHRLVLDSVVSKSHNRVLSASILFMHLLACRVANCLKLSCFPMRPKGKKFSTVHKYRKRWKVWNKSVKFPTAIEDSVTNDSDFVEANTRSVLECATDDHESFYEHLEDNIASSVGASVSAPASNIQFRISEPPPSKDEMAR